MVDVTPIDWNTYLDAIRELREARERLAALSSATANQIQNSEAFRHETLAINDRSESLIENVTYLVGSGMRACSSVGYHPSVANTPQPNSVEPSSAILIVRQRLASLESEVSAEMVRRHNHLTPDRILYSLLAMARALLLIMVVLLAIAVAISIPNAALVVFVFPFTIAFFFAIPTTIQAIRSGRWKVPKALIVVDLIVSGAFGGLYVLFLIGVSQWNMCSDPEDYFAHTQCFDAVAEKYTITVMAGGGFLIVGMTLLLTFRELGRTRIPRVVSPQPEPDQHVAVSPVVPKKPSLKTAGLPVAVGEYQAMLRSRRTFGAPGQDLSHAAGKFGTALVEKGQFGEQLTAEILESVQARFPSAVVFHGLPWPGSKADVDHAVVVGKTVVLIDTKMWKPAKYGNNQFKALVRDGQIFEGGNLHIDAAVDAWRSMFPRGTVMGAIVAIHPSNSRGHFEVAAGTTTPAGMPVVAADRLAETLSMWVARDNKEADIRILDAMYREMYKTHRTI